MALDGTYAGLIASVAQWAHRDDLTSLMPDFVTLAEARIARDVRVRNMIVSATLTTTADTQGVALPTGYLQAKLVTITSTTPNAPLKYETPEYLSTAYPNDFETGQPVIYSVIGNSLVLGPTPDDAYDIGLDYYAQFDSVITLSTNWLLVNAPGIYLAASMAEACVYTLDDPGQWNAKYAAEVAALHLADEKAAHSGSAMRVRSI